MQNWDELLRQALLGSARVSEPLPPLPETLAGLLPADAAPEEQLLSAAALLHPYRRLGTLPASCPETIATAPVEVLPGCGQALEGLLRELLEDPEQDTRLLTELLAGMAAIPCRVPADTLPGLLDLAVERKLALADLHIVGGERLPWLAAQHPQWSMLQGVPSQQQDDPWLSERISQRTEFLRQERGRDPEAARERLAEGFAQESARDRQALLECLAVNLRATDGEFLAACLEDRSQGVRQVAVGFLLRLGDNPTASRVAEQVAGMVSTEGLLRKTLVVNLPEAFDKDWQRLGLREKPPAGERIGQRAYWMLQWLGLLGPSRLAALLQVDLNTLSGLIKRSDYAREIKQCLAESAEALQDTEYACWCLRGAGPKVFPQLFVSVGGSLPATQREALLVDFLQQHSGKLEIEVLRTLLATHGKLSSNATQVLIAELEPLLKRLLRNPWSRRGLVEVADALAPTEAEALKALCQRYGSIDAVNEFWRRYAWRCRLHQALDEAGRR